MKIYVDENDYVITYCAMTGRESLETSKSPIIIESLSEYTEQVRVEVVEEIKKRLAEQRTKMQNDTHCYPQTVVCWQDIVAILDQVRGENNVKD